MSAVDRFLVRFYRERERRASPRTVSAETRTGGGMSDEARDRLEVWYAAAITRVARAGLSDREAAVLAAAYLQLANSHTLLLTRHWRSDDPPDVSAHPVSPGGEVKPDPARMSRSDRLTWEHAGHEAADLQSQLDFGELAKVVGLKHRMQAVRAYHDGRGKVVESLTILPIS